MNPFEIIENQKKVIENLTYKLKYSKNKQQDVKDINTLIHTLKCFDSMLVSKYKTDAIDKLICHVLEDYLLRFEVENNYKEKLNLPYIINKINMCILDKNFNAISRLSGQIVSYQISSNVINGINEIPNKEDVEVLIKGLLLEFKTKMVWNT